MNFTIETLMLPQKTCALQGSSDSCDCCVSRCFLTVFSRVRQQHPAACGPGEIFSVDLGGPVLESLAGTGLLVCSLSANKNLCANSLLEERTRINTLQGHKLKLLSNGGAKEIAAAARSLGLAH